MTDLAIIIRALHIAAGAVSLLAGGVALATRKGSRPHRLAGKVFLVAMLTIAASAVLLATIRPNPFLLFLGVFSLYLAVWGRVALARKGAPPHTPAPRLHFAPTLAFALFCAYFVAVAARSSFIVFQIFVALAVLLTLSHVRLLRRGGEYRVQWMLDHLAGFTTAYIASVTAFVVVNTPYLLPTTLPVQLAAWLGPTVIGVPLLQRMSNRLTAPERERKAASG